MAKYEYKVKGVDYVVEIQDIEGNIANVTVNGIPFEVEMKQPVKSSKQKVKLSEERRVKSEEFNSSSVIYTTHKRNRKHSYLEQQALCGLLLFCSPYRKSS